LVRLERFSEARVELLRAAEATESERDRRMLRKRVAFCEEKLLR
jgi:predicted RNA polymerase sigma factor